MALSPETLGYAFFGGLLPALIWLEFILKEDARCPEPRWVTVVAFVAGMVAVPIVLLPEHWACLYFNSCDLARPDLPTIISWAAIEETAKYALAALALWGCRRALRNPLDVVTCMLTVALGFAALENALFLIDPLAAGHFVAGLIAGNLRFIGSTLLHVVASSVIAFALAFTYRASRKWRMLAGAVGLILAIALHALFNFFIISQDGSRTVLAFFTVWTGAVVLFAAFEVLKYFKYRNLPKNTC